MTKMRIAIGVLSVAVLASCTKELNDPTQDTPTLNQGTETISSVSGRNPGQSYVPNEILVKFKEGTSDRGRANALARIGGSVLEHIRTKAMERFSDREGLYLVRTPMAVIEAVGKVKGLEIEYAEPNFIYTLDATSSDTYFTNGSLWGVYGDASTPANQYGSQAAEAWAAGSTGNSNIVVGIIDEGIQVTHPDLDNNIWFNPYDKKDGIDNDANGYIDDVNGWDFANNDATVYDGGNRGSLDKHGTHVAGTIGAESNGTGVVGVSWNVKMISAKFLGRNGGTTANAIKAVDYLTDLKIRHNIDLVASNNSWGGGGFSQALYDAIERANARNILFIAAAGNGGSDGVGDNNDEIKSYPSGYANANIIAVASITSTGARSSFSNYGATTVDIGAPGSGIYSTLPPGTYGSYSGTSMATPHVTGGAVLNAAKTGNRGNALKTAILGAAIPTPSMQGKCSTNGRLNVSGF